MEISKSSASGSSAFMCVFHQWSPRARLYGVALIVALGYLFVGRLSSHDSGWVQVNLPLSAASVLLIALAGVEAYFALLRWQRRYHELQESRAREIELAERLAEQRRGILNQISSGLLDKLDLHQIPTETLQRAALLFETDVVAVWVAEKTEQGLLEPRGVCGLNDVSAHELSAIGRATPCFDRVAKEARQVVVRDFANETAPGLARFCEHKGLLGGVFTPIINRGKVIGVLSVFYHHRREVPAPLIAEMQTIANLFASAIQAEELYHDLIQFQKIDSLGNLAGGIAHDFNNLLAATLACVSYVKQLTPPNTPAYSYLEAAESSTHRGAALTKQLLSYARREGPLPSVLNPNDAIEQTLKILQRTFDTSIELKIDFAPDIRPVDINPSQFEQVILNLCLNARDAMPTGGTLTFSTRNVCLDGTAPSRPAISLPDGDYVVINVSDTGHGISTAAMPHIFEPFFTTKSRGEGTGLGLSLVRTIVRGAGGDVWVESQAGKGAKFEVFLPVTSKALPASTPLPASTVRGGHERILLIEDEDVIREMTRLTLEAKGYTVMPASDGPSAVALYEQKWKAIDLVITDMMMPGLSGPHLLARLKGINPGVRIVVSSGCSYEFEGTQMLQHGCLGYLQKPYRPDDLIRLVRAVLDSGV